MVQQRVDISSFYAGHARNTCFPLQFNKRHVLRLDIIRPLISSANVRNVQFPVVYQNSKSPELFKMVLPMLPFKIPRNTDLPANNSEYGPATLLEQEDRV